MPIILGEVGYVPNVPVVEEPQVFRITWTSPLGRVTEFYSLGTSLADFVTMPGVTGFDMPVFTAYTDTSPGFDGEINRGFRTEARDISIPILMYAWDRKTFKKMRQDLFTDLNPRSGAPGRLTVTEWDGSDSRSIECFYAGGLEGALDDSEQGMDFSKAIIEFRAPDPYWVGATISPRPLKAVDDSGWLPLFPIRVTASQILGNTTITNLGQGDAFPTFVITGPATTINLRNNTTGEEITLNYNLAADDVITINTREGRKSVKLNGVTNLYPYLSIDSTLWALKPGINDVTFTLPGESIATTLAFSYQERFLAAW